MNVGILIALIFVLTYLYVSWDYGRTGRRGQIRVLMLGILGVGLVSFLTMTVVSILSREDAGAVVGTLVSIGIVVEMWRVANTW
ncbi:hypothetical protein QE370_001435 [Aeromicrobium sp. SORGH_AS981]|nr:hypothetical protein [Aeromicrobium sp. SORGH_AS_0981]